MRCTNQIEMRFKSKKWIYLLIIIGLLVKVAITGLIVILKIR